LVDAGNFDFPCFSDVKQSPKFSGIPPTNDSADERTRLVLCPRSYVGLSN
jgi:hypothetical protein